MTILKQQNKQNYNKQTAGNLVEISQAVYRAVAASSNIYQSFVQTTRMTK